jgi:transcriptional regulator with PAS, ATPase and Fis domain
VSLSRGQVESFLAKSLRLIGEEVPSSRVLLVLLDRRLKPVRTKSWPGPDAAFESVCSGLACQAGEEKRPLFVESSAARSAGPPPLDCRPGNLLCVPLLMGEVPLGAVCLGREPGQTPYSSADLESVVFLTQSFPAAIKDGLDLAGQADCLIQASDSDSLIGESRVFNAIQTLIERVKNSAAPVFIYGESGTGKELVARAIHARGTRRAGPFVAVNCGAIPDYLLESELFGHVRGSFTGALRDKAGLLEEANGGTFFLDEIGDLSPPLQAKLLRLLQEKEIRRVGETRTRRIDVRFISATNKELEKEIEQGRFRMDLYYRLRILTIEVPPLRERREDLLLLVNHFVDKYGREMGRERTYVSPGALELMAGYSWPGNIRELQNEIQRCLVLAGGDRLIREEHLSAKVNPRPAAAAPVTYNYFLAKSEFEKRFIHQALVRFGHNKARTAKEVGLTRQGLFKLLKKHKIGENSEI